jgi:hypothetical protein
MKIHTPALEYRDERCRWSAKVQFSDTEALRPAKCRGTSDDFELWIDWPASYHEPDPENLAPFTAIALPLALVNGGQLVVEGYLPETFVLNCLETIGLYRSFYPDMVQPLAIEANTRWTGVHTLPRVASFYSGGIDSLFNIAEMESYTDRYGSAAINDLWLVQGMDIPLPDEARWSVVKNRLRELASTNLSGMELVDIRTNARDLHRPVVPWASMGHGPILGGIAKCFSNKVSTVLVGSGRSYPFIAPWASTPYADSLWSCERQQVRHFSARFDRQDKTQRLVDLRPELLSAARVCYENTGDSYNCGRCEKCMRTRLQLIVAGYEKAETLFENKATLKDYLAMTLPWRKSDDVASRYWRLLHHALKEQQQHKAVWYVRIVLWKHRLRKAAGSLLRGLRLVR